VAKEGAIFHHFPLNFSLSKKILLSVQKNFLLSISSYFLGWKSLILGDVEAKKKISVLVLPCEKFAAPPLTLLVVLLESDMFTDIGIRLVGNRASPLVARTDNMRQI